MSMPAAHHDESASGAGSASPVRSPRAIAFATAPSRPRRRACVLPRRRGPARLLRRWAGALRTILGHGPNDLFPYAVDDNLRPVGPLSRVPDTHAALVDDYGEIVPPAAGTGTTLLILGADGALGRDLFLRLLYGGQVSIEVGRPRCVDRAPDRRLPGCAGGDAGRGRGRRRLEVERDRDGVPDPVSCSCWSGRARSARGSRTSRSGCSTRACSRSRS